MDLIQGDNATFYMNVSDGSTPIYTGVSGVTIDIYHFNGGFVYDVASGSMIQQASPFANIWYYTYQIPLNADVTTYNSVYTAYYSGNIIQTTESFSVLPSAFSFPSPIGGGTISVSGSIVDASGNGIYPASLVVTSVNTAFAATTTDISGNYAIVLNAGSYIFGAYATRYFSNQVAQTIPSGTNWLVAPIGLQLDNQGAVQISDTFLFKTPQRQLIPLPNLKVSLFPQDSIGGDLPTAIAYTDVSGTFVMNANAGLYSMTVQGEFWNPVKNRNDRYNYQYDIEVNPVWSGTGISGTSTPYNFQYLDTSKYNYIGGGYSGAY